MFLWPGGEIVSQLNNQSINQLINQLINQSINQSNHPPMFQWPGGEVWQPGGQGSHTDHQGRGGGRERTGRQQQGTTTGL